MQMSRESFTPLSSETNFNDDYDVGFFLGKLQSADVSSMRSQTATTWALCENYSGFRARFLRVEQRFDRIVVVLSLQGNLGVRSESMRRRTRT